MIHDLGDPRAGGKSNICFHFYIFFKVNLGSSQKNSDLNLWRFQFWGTLTWVPTRGGSRMFPREGRLVQRGGIFRVGGRRDLTWAPYPHPISYLYTYEYVISRNINSIDLR